MPYSQEVSTCGKKRLKLSIIDKKGNKLLEINKFLL